LTNKISVTVLTKNSSKYLAKCLQSVAKFNEIVVLDNGSTDNTIEIAKSFVNVKVYESPFIGFGPLKNLAVSYASNDWIFSLDSDELVTKELFDELNNLKFDNNFYGYFVPRLNNFFGKEIKTCGLYPDYTIRLFDRTKAQFSNVQVHESVQLKSNIGYLKSDIYHHAYSTIEEFIAKQNRYSTLNHKKKSVLKAIINPYWTFFKLYFLKLGFLDGWHGFIISKLYSQYTFWKYIK